MNLTSQQLSLVNILQEQTCTRRQFLGKVLFAIVYSAMAANSLKVSTQYQLSFMEKSRFMKHWKLFFLIPFKILFLKQWHDFKGNAFGADDHIKLHNILILAATGHLLHIVIVPSRVYILNHQEPSLMSIKTDINVILTMRVGLHSK